MRGENFLKINVVDAHPGTSPRARGKPITVVTPDSEFKEHPRVRGENLVWRMSWGFRCGTSPRARGKPPSKGAHQAPTRNIPACAGKTGMGAILLHRSTEHPRVRGENVYTLYCVVSTLRNIPACAGKTFQLHALHAWNKEHPRVRGENNRSVRRFVNKCGTSPRARGKLRVSIGSHRDIRNIPACAGKTTNENYHL